MTAPLREIRGLNYGDYAYIEFFNQPGFQFFPSPNIARRAQAFEIWIRPVVPANAQMSMRIALYELQKLDPRVKTAYLTEWDNEPGTPYSFFAVPAKNPLSSRSSALVAT